MPARPGCTSRNGPDERAQHDGQVPSGIAFDAAEGLAHLHLVHPPLGQVLGIVEPDRDRAVASPADASVTQHVHGRVVGVHSLPRPVQQLGDHRLAQSLSAIDPPLVLRRQCRHERVVIVHRDQTALVPIATAGQPPEVIVEQVQSQVLDAPTRGGARRDPLLGREWVATLESGSFPGPGEPTYL